MPEPERLPKFTRTARAVHWLHALGFMTLLVTGLIIFIPALSAQVDHRPVIRQLHILVGVELVLGPILVAALGNLRAVWEDVKEVDTWDDDDFEWVKRTIGIARQVFGERVPQGRFNAGQKLNSIFTAATLLGFLATGIIMWQFKRFPVWLVENANVLHDWLTIAVLLVWLGHVYLAVANPGTRESLRGITLGWVKAGWAQEHHRKWYERVVDKGK